MSVVEENARSLSNKNEPSYTLQAILSWGLLLFGLLTLIYPRVAHQPLLPAYTYSNLKDFSFWQIPFVYVGSYFTRAGGPLLFAFMLGGIIASFIPRETMKRYMSSRNFGSYMIGASSAPLLTVCSCAMIPVFGGILISGAGIGPAISFFLVAPAANILSLIFTIDLISWKIALTRLFFSWLGAIFIGLIVSRTSWGRSVETRYSGIERLTVEDEHKPSFSKKSWNASIEAGHLARMVLPYLILGVAGVSFIEAYLPPQIVSRFLVGLKGIILGGFIGVPFYTPTLVEVFLTKAMINLGMSPSAAVAFLIGGPMASIPSMLGVSRLIGWKTVFTYASLAVILSIIAGIIYSLTFTTL